MTTIKCALRALTLCDGDRCEGFSILAERPACYCTAIASDASPDDAERLQELRTARAQTLARADRVKRTAELRQLIEGAAARADSW